MSSRDIVTVIEKTLAFAVDDSVLAKSTNSQSKIVVDIDLTVSTLRAASRLPLGAQADPVRTMPSPLANGNFFDYW